MAKRKTPAITGPPLSDLAQWLINAFGLPRLKMMRDEYESDLPHDMPSHIRQQRIEAINELYPPTRKLAKTEE